MNALDHHPIHIAICYPGGAIGNYAGSNRASPLYPLKIGGAGYCPHSFLWHPPVRPHIAPNLAKQNPRKAQDLVQNPLIIADLLLNVRA